jgi:diadenylate cyclase
MKSNERVMMEQAAALAKQIGARAIVSFTEPCECETDVPVIWVEELPLDVLKDLTMQDILEVTERHLLNAAVQIYLSRILEEGQVIGVFPYALIIYDIKEGKNFINVSEFANTVPRDVIHAVLTLALEIAVEGREGRSVGTAFIVGNGEAILKHSHQAILNPYQGQDPEDCDVKKRDNWESVKEFAQIDGVFVIDQNGCILSAGRYLDINAGIIYLPKGLGGRHRAAAAITKILPVIGITVSESGGMVRVFQGGECRISIRSDAKIHPIDQ